MFQAEKASLQKLLSRVRLFVTPWTVAYQAPLSMEFSRQEAGNPFQTTQGNRLSCRPLVSGGYSLLQYAGLSRDCSPGHAGKEGPHNPFRYSCLENPHGQRSLAGSSP